MEKFNRGNSRNTGFLKTLTSWMLIGSNNSPAEGISIQISEIPAGSSQPVHSHAPEQCYYIIRGKGLMIIEDDMQEVSAGDAVYIPPNKAHGIKNPGHDVLEYLTANSPAFTKEYENTLWPTGPESK